MAERHVLDHPADERKPKPQPTPVSAAPPPKPSRRWLIVSIISLAVIAVVGFIVWKLFFASPPVPANIVILSGRIEGDDSAVSPKAGGRILEIHFREGDSVNAGDII